MGDMADWTIDQGMATEAQAIEYWAQAKRLSNDEIVEALEDYDGEQPLDEHIAVKVQGICEWYREKGFLTPKQRTFLNGIYVDLIGEPWE